MQKLSYLDVTVSNSESSASLSAEDSMVVCYKTGGEIVFLTKFSCLNNLEIC